MMPTNTVPADDAIDPRRRVIAATFEAYLAAFEIPDNGVLRAFRRLVHDEHLLLEYSVKLDERGTHPARFAIIYDGDMRARIERIIEFFDEAVGSGTGRIDASLIAAIVRGLDLRKVDMCACGFDLRPIVEDCRFKLWVSIRNQPRKVDELLGLLDAPPEVLDFILANDLPVGVDLDLRGNTRLKLYAQFTPEDRANRAIRRRLEAALSPAALALMPHVERLNVSFDPDFSRVLHLQALPHQQQYLLEQLGLVGHPVIERGARLGLRPHVISLSESAIGQPKIPSLNIYFIPRALQGA